MNPTRLPDHPAFLRLTDTERSSLLACAEVWEGPAGSVLYHPGDSGEDLVLLLSGRLEYADRLSGEKRWMAGEMWGDDRLARPETLSRSLVLVEGGRWLRWPRRVLMELLSGSPGLVRGLAPLRDDARRLVSGLPELPVSAAVPVRGKRLRATYRPAITGLFLAVVGAVAVALAGIAVEGLPVFAPLVPPALLVGWLLVFSFGRLFNEYGIEADSITSRTFDWSRFAAESRHVPLDRIQGVQAVRNGLVRRLLDYGDVIVKTSALEGELVLRGIASPDRLAGYINGLRDNDRSLVEGRDRESIRRSLEASGLASEAPRMVRAAAPLSKGTEPAGDLRFRKSPVVLFGRLVLPVLVTLLPLLGAGMISGMTDAPENIIRLAALLPLAWAWYVFEDWRNDNFRVSGGYAVDLYRKPLGLKESRRQVDLASVQNIRTEQKGPLSVLFRFGDVVLVTAGGASDTVFRNVSRPWRVQQALFRAREEGLRIESEQRMEEHREDLLRFAEAMQQIREA